MNKDLGTKTSENLDDLAWRWTLPIVFSLTSSLINIDDSTFIKFIYFVTELYQLIKYEISQVFFLGSNFWEFFNGQKWLNFPSCLLLVYFSAEMNVAFVFVFLAATESGFFKIKYRKHVIYNNFSSCIIFPDLYFCFLRCLA